LWPVPKPAIGILGLGLSKAYGHNFIELMSNSTACEHFFVLMKKIKSLW